METQKKRKYFKCLTCLTPMVTEDTIKLFEDYMSNDKEFYTIEIQAMLSNLKIVSWKFCFDCRITVEESHNSVGSAVTRSTEIKVYPLYPFSLLKRDEENQPLTPEEKDEATDLLTASAEKLAREEFRR